MPGNGARRPGPGSTEERIGRKKASLCDRLKKAALLTNLENELTQGLIRGDRQDDIIRRFAKRMETSLSSAGRLIATESAFFAAKGEYDNMKDLGVEKYQFVATLDSRTSEICRDMDMKVIPMKDFKPGVTAPPLHCWCRSCTVPYMDEMPTGFRAARDERGYTTHVEGMNYADWKAIYVDQSKTLRQWRREHSGESGAGSVKMKVERNYNTPLARAVGKEHYDKFHDLLDGDQVPESVLKLWQRFENRLRYVYESGGAYSLRHEIHLDIRKEARGSSYSAPYQTLFHEAGHAIDWLGHFELDTPLRYYSAVYKESAFPKAIKADVDAMIKRKEAELKPKIKELVEAGDVDGIKALNIFDRSELWWVSDKEILARASKYKKAMTYKAIAYDLNQDDWLKVGDACDMIGGATKNRIKLNIGHTTKYWRDRVVDGVEEGLAAEGFAEFTSAAIANPESLAFLKENLPTAYKVYFEMVEDMAKELEERDNG